MYQKVLRFFFSDYLEFTKFLIKSEALGVNSILIYSSTKSPQKHAITHKINASQKSKDYCKMMIVPVTFEKAST